MNKDKKLNVPSIDLSKYSRSTFTLTFAVEVVGLEIWQNCENGWLEQGPWVQSLKLQYQLYPGQNYDLDIQIWPYTAKIWCKEQYGWVRTWRFLERIWFTFSISHAFPVRVLSLHSHLVTINPSYGGGNFGLNAKNDKNFKVYLPPLGFGMRRYFAPVLETEEETLVKFLQELVWSVVKEYIPKSCFDEPFDTPHEVSDVRHQDVCLDCVQNLILSQSTIKEIERTVNDEQEDSKRRDSKDKQKKKNVENVSPKKFEIKLTGENILAGTGRVIPFETVGETAPDSPEIIALISSNNLPAQDDLPIVFLNVENLFQIPLNELKMLRVTKLYTKWRVGDEDHRSEPVTLNSQPTVNFKDYRAVPIPYSQLSKITLEFLDDDFVIQLRGIKLPTTTKCPKLFGYEKGDRDFGKTVPKFSDEELDFLIANTKIDTKSLAKSPFSYVKGEYPLYPPRVIVKSKEREGFCTNDINFVRIPVTPKLIVPPDVILLAQMSLEVSIGMVGCRIRHGLGCYSRMFCATKDSDSIMKMLRFITDINEDIILLAERKEELLSGFALDTGNIVVLFLEGPKDGHILQVWDMTQDFYPKVKPMFSCSDRYSSRIYPEFIETPVPFITLKMFVPLGVLLACPPVYTRPTLPLPTRSALLKIGNLAERNMHNFPSRSQIPTVAELRSFRLELCVAPRPTPVVITNENVLSDEVPRPSAPGVSRINWKNKLK